MPRLVPLPVLTLLLLEFGFGAAAVGSATRGIAGLNPSFTGIWLRGNYLQRQISDRCEVLTLLLLEFGFGEGHRRTYRPRWVVGLNPSFTGIWLRGLNGVKSRGVHLWVLTLLLLEFGFGGHLHTSASKQTIKSVRSAQKGP